MPSENEILSDFPECHGCGSRFKVSEKLFADKRASGEIAEDTFTSLRLDVTNLENAVIPGMMVKAILVYHDICDKCGMERVTRVERGKIKQPGFGGPGINNVPPFFNSPGKS